VTELAAIVFCVAIAGVVAFQVALVLGAPWGAYAMGGAAPGRFPAPLRVLALVQAVLLVGLALIVLARARLAVPELAGAAGTLVWIVVGVSALAVLLNAASRSAGERRIWLPVALVLLGSSLVLALAAP
jgi:hypothetical protein